MRFTRREAAKLALSAVPAGSLLVRPLALLAQKRPSSTINGVRVGAITYSYRTMPDQSAEAILRYVVDSGISQIEFMGGPVEAFAGAPQAQGGGGGRRGGQPPTPEQQAAQREAADKLTAWRTSVSMDRFKTLRKMLQRRWCDDLCVEAAAAEHVGWGVRVRLQRRGGARVHAHDAGADRRRRRNSSGLARLPRRRKFTRRITRISRGACRRSTRPSRCREAIWRMSTSATSSQPAEIRSRFSQNSTTALPAFT